MTSDPRLGRPKSRLLGIHRIGCSSSTGMGTAGSEVMVFSFDGEGAKEARACTVRVDGAGSKYVAFDDATLGAYAVGIYRAGGDGDGDGGDVVRVIGEARGDGFVNYEGAYTWPKAGAVRYLFTPVVPGSELASVEVTIDGAPV